MRRNTEWNPGNLFEEQRCVRRPVGEMNVHVVDFVTPEEICEIEAITRALLCLGIRSVFTLMLLDQVAWPSAVNFRVPL